MGCGLQMVPTSIGEASTLYGIPALKFEIGDSLLCYMFHCVTAPTNNVPRASLQLLRLIMLRRLVHRFGEEGVSGVGADATVSGVQSSGISQRVEEIELDVDSEEVRG